MRWLCALALALAACAKSESPKPAPSPDDELRQGLDACQAYVVRLCDCANHDPSLVDACNLAMAQPDAIRVQLRMLRNPKIKDDDRVNVELGAKKGIKVCLDAAAALDEKKCPKPAGP